MGKYYLPINKAMQTLMGEYGEAVAAPPITKRTLELGSLHSPDFACVPFKYTLGNLIEALDNGANILFNTASGYCRLRFYAEVQEQILKDMGYNFKYYTFDATRKNPKEIFEAFKNINPKLTFAEAVGAFILCVRIIYAMDDIEHYIRKNIGFEAESGSLEKMEKLFLTELVKTKSVVQADAVYRKYIKKIKAIPLNKPDKVIKVGIVGELYILMEPFSNYFMEKELAKFGIEVTRFITVSYRSFSFKHTPGKLFRQAGGYVNYELGADGTDTVAKSVLLAKQGYDGIIHMKPFGCIPEINSIPMVQKISKDYKIPALYFSFDSQTSETGVKTRLEAFYDMLMMKKKGITFL
jgi:predicted nucleotide-binding protein (sugar kinase/HSP70/actin superfamily)